MSRCKYWDSGWCYHDDGPKAGCPGGDKCPIESRKVSRPDIVGQNGNTGEHYIVEDVAKLIQKSHLVNARYDWEDFIPLAIAIVEKINGH